MIYERENILKNISKILAITRYDIEQRQILNDYSLNIHAENYFMEIFNFVYGLDLQNANFESKNISCIDLIDKKAKLAYQITTTRTKEKIKNTLQALKKPQYKGYKIRIYYLLEKANPNKDLDLEKEYNINLKECLFDYSDLLKEIGNLPTDKLMGLNKKYFEKMDFYTDEIALNLIFGHILKSQSSMRPNYDDELGNIETEKKIELNNINSRIKANINGGLDYVSLMNDINEKDNLLDELRILIVDNLYKQILIEHLSKKVPKSTIMDKSLVELHTASKDNGLDFNKIMNDLSAKIESKIDMIDFNSNSVSWIIIAYFFEICDIGVKK